MRSYGEAKKTRQVLFDKCPTRVQRAPDECPKCARRGSSKCPASDSNVFQKCPTCLEQMSDKCLIQKCPSTAGRVCLNCRYSLQALALVLVLDLGYELPGK
jgi:hypothetical protein